MLLHRLLELDRFEIHYLTRRFNPAYEPVGYTLHQIAPRKTLYGSFVLDSSALYKLLRRLNPDAIYQRVACTHTGVAAWYAKRAGCQFIWHVSSDRDLTPASWKFAWRSAVARINKGFIQYGGHNADKVIVQNAEQARHLLRYFGRADAVRIPNFHPAPEALPPKKAERLLVCWIGNIKALKQPEIFLRLAGDFDNHPNVEFVMVGAQQMRDESWQEIRASMGSLPNLSYIGQQPADKVEEILAGAHVLVNTSSVEGFPNTFIQAWLREVPVVSYSVNPDQVFADGKYGFCANGDYRRLRDALANILADAPRRRNLGVACRLFASTRFSERNIDRIIDLLDD